MIEKTGKYKFFDSFKTKFYHTRITSYCIDKQTDKTIHGFENQFQKNKDWNFFGIILTGLVCYLFFENQFLVS